MCHVLKRASISIDGIDPDHPDPDRFAIKSLLKASQLSESLHINSICPGPIGLALMGVHHQRKNASNVTILITNIIIILGIRILVALLLDTLPMLGNVLAICTLIFVVFGIIGVQLWQGVLRNRCALELPAGVNSSLA